MKYIELREEEKAELRDTLFFQCLDPAEETDYFYLSAEEQSIVDNCESPEVIPESVMISAFGKYDFVEEDFFCNLDSFDKWEVVPSRDDWDDEE